MNEKIICPNCEEEKLAKVIYVKKAIKVKGESITVPVSLFRCLDCGEEFENRLEPIDELDLAYREYRKKHKMLQPEEIRTLREEIGLTQNELAQLLGWSPATISRYENGSLQELSHDNLLQTLREPMNILHLLERSGNSLPSKRAKEIHERALAQLPVQQEQVVCESLMEEGKDIYSGNVPFSFDKYLAVTNRIIEKCPGDGVPKTKLNKLLFYCDFLNYRDKNKSITGSRYEHIPYGPCPKHFQSLLGVMLERGYVSIQVIQTKDNYEAELICANQKIASDILSKEEKEIIDFVCHKFGRKNSKELTDFSHAEEAYKKTKNGETISYQYARSLRLV